MENLMTSCHIVFLPGLFASGWIWNNVAKDCKKFGHEITVIEPSIPEIFGGSLKNAHSIIQDCLYQKKEPAILIGNSMSGLIALDFASQHPDEVEGLIISGAPGLDELEAGVALADLRKGCPESADILGSRVIYDKSNLPEKDYMKGVCEIQKVFASTDTFKCIIKWLNISRKYQVLNALPNIKCPIQLLWGDHDLITPSASWITLSKQYETISYAEVENCGHSPMLEKPNEFIALMSPYLDKLSHSHSLTHSQSKAYYIGH